MFGNFFDLNGDGRTDALELAFGASALFALAEELDGDDSFEDEDEDEDDALTVDVGRESELAALEERLSELQDKLSDLELEEPDAITSAAYERWECRVDRLREQIEALEERIAEAQTI